MTHAENIYGYLWSIAPDGATNGEIARVLGIVSHQTVYMTTQDLARRGRIRGERAGREWLFYALETQPALHAVSAGDELTPRTFESLTQRVLGDRFAVALTPGRMPSVRKKFDLVSPDGQIVGDAKYYTRVGGIKLPPAKFSIISEHVWLLEKTGAPITFLVFGNDRQVPILWLERYGNLLTDVIFYFLHDDGRLEVLTGPDNLG